MAPLEAARADSLVIPGYGPAGYGGGTPAPTYRATPFPPAPYYDASGQNVGDVAVGQPYRATPFPPREHYDAFGQPVPADVYGASPYHAAPVAAQPENYGGRLVELLATGQAPGPHGSPEDYEPAAGFGHPAYAAPAYRQPAQAYADTPRRAALTQGGLPDYAPQPQAYYGNPRQAQAYYGGAPQAGQGASADPLVNDPGLATRPINPIYERQEVAYDGRERPGTIVIDTPNKFLFLVESGGRALRYGIGVGRPGFSWAGVKTISRKAEWPDWTPPAEMLARRPDLPRHMEGGIANPLGARALYLGSSLYRIHGTNEPYTIGTNVSSGCIRMMNQDVVDLYGRVGVGTRVIVM